MDYFSVTFLLSVLQIVWIDLLLSGDNAVVIAMACRSLPPRQRKLGMFLGAGTAVMLRIMLAILVTKLLAVPYLKIAGSLLLLWIATRLVLGDEDGGTEIKATSSLWRAVRTIALADVIMSLDNVVAIAAAAGGRFELFILGLMLSIPLIMISSTLIMSLLQRFPILVWAGAALLGWIAGEMLVSDPMLLQWLSGTFPGLVLETPHASIGRSFSETEVLHYGAATAGAILVVVAGFVLSRITVKRSETNI